MIIAFGSILIFISVFYLVLILNFIFLNKHLENWLVVDGEIIQSSLQQKKESFIYDEEDFNKSEFVKYQLKINYSYKINDETFESKNLFASKIASFFLSSKQHKNLQKKFLLGNFIKIYVNPENHSKSALVRHIPVLAKFLFAIILLSSGIFFVLYSNLVVSFF